MLRVALLCFDNPFLPPMEGGKRGMLSRIKALGLCDVSIDLYLLCKREEGLVSSYEGLLPSNVARVYQYSMNKLSLGAVLSKQPLCCEKRFVSDMVHELSAHEYDVALYEGEQMMKYRLSNCVNASRHVIFFHDIESNYRYGLAKSEKNFIKRYAQGAEARKFNTFERAMAGLFDEALFVSLEEKQLGEALGVPGAYAPYSVEGVASCIAGAANHTMLYVGDMGLDSNFQSVLWFCTNVLGEVLSAVPDSKVVLVGRISDEKRAQLAEIPHADAIEIKGYVESLRDEYQSAALVLGPVLFGAGVKVKIIDALCEGQIVVATEKALEGTHIVGGVHVLAASEPLDFASHCINVLENRDEYKNLVEDALCLMREEHSLEGHARILMNALEGAAS